MKRIFPAIIILVITICLCICSYIYVTRECDATNDDIDKFLQNKISSLDLQNSWQERKEKLSFFVNHGFLDDMSLYIGQLSVYDDQNSERFDLILKNIDTLLSMIKQEQHFATHSFY